MTGICDEGRLTIRQLMRVLWQWPRNTALWEKESPSEAAGARREVLPVKEGCNADPLYHIAAS